jgi:hypothetical protein
LLILGTYRPVELIVHTHPLKSATAELHLHGHYTELALGYLGEDAVAAYVAHRFLASVAQTVAPVLYQQSAGHPLFMVHLRLAESRRVQGHRRIGARLEAGYGAFAAEMAAELAGHFERGQDAARAITYHTQAGQQALGRSAHQEAVGHGTTALTLLATLPESPARAQ